MSKKLEDYLRKGMQQVGGAVEKAIGQADEARKTMVQQVGTATTAPVQRGATVEQLLNGDKIREILQCSVDSLISGLIPALADHKVVQISEMTGRYTEALVEQGATMSVAVEIGAGGVQTQPDPARRSYVVRSMVQRLPFSNGVFDFAIANLVTPYQGNALSALKEISRTMVTGATVVLADYHPFGSYAKKGSNRVRPADSPFRGLADYYKGAELAGLRITDVFEGFVDESVRPCFVSDEEKEAYRSLRDTPIVLCYVATKRAEAAA